MMALASLCAATWGANNPVPLIATPLNPAAVAPGGEAFTLTVNGTGFVPGAVVNWNGTPRTTTFVSGSRVTAAIGAVDVAVAGTATITVINPPPGGGTSNPEYFLVTKATPTVAFQDTVLPITAGLSSQVLVGDFNGDGKADLIVLQDVLDADSNSHQVLRILLGHGDGTFDRPLDLIQAPRGAGLSGLAVGDFNGDGKVDAVGFFVDSEGSGIFVLLGNGDGTFQGPIASDRSSAANTLTSLGTTAVADVNGDGILDVVRACITGVCVELGNGDGTFRPGFIYSPKSPTEGGPFGARSVVVGDFHKTGKLDIVAGIQVGLRFFLVMLPGIGDGTFGEPKVVFDGGGILESITAADFDADGNLDLAFLAPDTNRLSPTEPPNARAASIMKGNGDGTFQAPLTLGGLPGTTQASAVIAADLNGDGQIDLVARNTVVLIKSLATDNVNYSVVSEPASYATMAIGDFTGDGTLSPVAVDFIGQEHLLSQIDPGDFRGEVEGDTTRMIGRGAEARFKIKITAINGFEGAVSFDVGGLPDGAKATFCPSTISGSGETTLTIRTAHQTVDGSYVLTLTGTSGRLTHSGTITVNIGPRSEFADFAGSVQETFQTTTPGGSTTFHISSLPLNGFHRDIQLSVSGLPDGAMGSFSPREIEDGSGSSVLTVTTGAGTATGTYPLTITGTTEGHRHHQRTHSTVVNLNVGPVGTDFTDFTVAAAPESQAVVAGRAVVFTISTQAINGPEDIFVQADGGPSPSVTQFYPFNLILGGTGSVMVGVQTSPDTVGGTYLIRVHLSNNRVAHEVDLALTVTP
jgi:hypothetical protein